MGALNLQNLRPWKPGQSGNTGRKIPENLRGILSLSQLEVTKLISKYARMTLKEMIEAKTSTKISVLELAFIEIFQKSMTKGDFIGISFLLDRCIGKVKDIIETPEESAEREELSKIPLKDLLVLIQNNISEEAK